MVPSQMFALKVAWKRGGHWDGTVTQRSSEMDWPQSGSTRPKFGGGYGSTDTQLEVELENGLDNSWTTTRSTPGQLLDNCQLGLGPP